MARRLDGRISDLIAELQEIYDRHGDLRVVAYTDHTGREYRDVGAEHNDDNPDDPVCLLEIELDEASMVAEENDLRERLNVRPAIPEQS